MTIEEFKKISEKLINWIGNYYENIRSFPVKSNVKPKDIINSLPDSIPQKGVQFEKIFYDFETKILKGITHWQHPRFFAYFPANTSFPSILGELLTSALGVQGMIWLTSPAATELEEKVVYWLRDAMGLTKEFTGVLQDTASTATLVSILTAREKASNYCINEEGFYNSQKFTVYCSKEAHSSIDKAVKIAGIGLKNLRKIPVDNSFSMIPEVLEQTIQEDIERGFRPLCIVGALGTTGSTAIDPLETLGNIAKKYDIWLHIDGAMAGSALLLPEFQYLSKGIDLADTFVFNPHKWLFTNFDCSVYFVKDKTALLKTFQITPSYLQTDFDKEVNNYRDWGIQLGRRFRALKLWFVLSYFGLEGLREKLRQHLQFTNELKKMISKDTNFEILAPVNFTTICFRYVGKDRTFDEEELNRINKKILDSINESGFAFLSHTLLNGKFAIRFSIGQTNTELKDITETWNFIKNTANKVIYNGA
ncbi:MAG: pyridoxal-dependent decarboxylase [Ignavibacteria bacterium]|nr:pyridoxal-dependent decarboxylase [Ignavibacteria bacterium]